MMASFRDNGRIWTFVKSFVAVALFLHFCSVYFGGQYARDMLLPSSSSSSSKVTKSSGKILTASDRSIVVSKTRGENIDWLAPFLQEFPAKTYIYSMDPEPEERFLVPRTIKGHESGAYLTYLVDNYDNLPPYSIFIHANDEQWHNDPGPKTKTALRFLRYEAVDAKGYVNLRCTSIPGCPNTLIPVKWEPVDYEYHYVSEKFLELYSYLLQVPMEQVPKVVGHTCCSQFAVSREQVHARPKSDYEHILNWVMTTDFTDDYGIGWTLEKLWHVLFGRPAVDCPNLEQCYCDNYGWCGPLSNGETLTPVMPKARLVRD